MKSILGLSLCAMLATTSVMADQLSISANAMDFNYKEYSLYDGQLMDSEAASYLYGFTAKYEHTLFGSSTTTNQGVLFTHISLYSGNSNYVGAYLGSSQPYGSLTGTTKNEIINGKLGYRQYKNLASVTLYSQLAIGYRYWDRKLSSAQDEKYQWAYGNIEIGMDGHLTPNDRLGLHLSYDLAINPTMKATIAAENYTFDLGKTYGYAFTVPYTHRFTARLSMQIAYTYQQWRISASNFVNNYYEPRSTTIQNIGSVGLIYNY
jgi:hypothetical protein